MIEQILQLMDEGKGLRAVAEELGVTYGKVRWELQKHNNAVAAQPTTQDSAPNDALAAQPFIVYVWDLETTNLNTFFGKLTVASFLDLNTNVIVTSTLNDYEGSVAERETQLIAWVLWRIEEADVLIGHNTLAFDVSFLRGRMAANGFKSLIPKRIHYDTYQIARFGFKGRPQGYSLENLADFFRLPIQKDKPSKHDWADSVILDDEAIDRIALRCEADVRVNALVWDRLRPYMNQWKGR